jgi:NADH dehydrogenase
MGMAQGDTKIVIAGAGYAGLRVALRLASRHPARRQIAATLIDRHDYHQLLTELPQVAGGSQPAGDARVPLDALLDERISFVETAVVGFDFAGRQLLTEAGPFPYDRLVLALGSRPNDFGIPGLAERALPLWSVDDAKRLLAAIDAAVSAAVGERDPAERRRLLTVAIGGGGATGVELAGELAEQLPPLARRHDLPVEWCRVVLIDGSTILGGSSAALVERASRILDELGVEVRASARIVRADARGFVLADGETIASGVCVWAGGVKAPALVAESGLVVGHNGRVRVDRFLRALDHPEIFVAGDLASVVDRRTGRALPPTAQLATQQGALVAANLLAELAGRPLKPFSYVDKGTVIPVGGRGVAEIAGRALEGSLVRLLKEAIDWEYRQSVRHLRGWSPLTAAAAHLTGR